MSRGIHASVITELAKDAFNMAHLVSIDFTTPKYLTDFGHDIEYDGNTYTSSSHILQMSQVNETHDVQVGSFTLNLSGVDQAFIAILLGENYIDREVIISRVVLDSSGAIIGNPIPMYTGYIDGYQMKDDNKTSQINLSIASQWSDFERESGRRTNHNSQQVYFADDDGLKFASNTDTVKWGRA
jgi:hypothetical protein